MNANQTGAAGTGVISADVVIVGAGIAGLALSVALADQGLSVAIIDGGTPPQVSDEWQGKATDCWDSRVSALTPTSTELLDSLGAWESMKALRVAPYYDMQVWDADGTGRIAFSAAEASVAQLGHIVENRITVAALAELATGHRLVQCLWQQRVADIEWLKGGTVRLTTDSGEAIEGAVVVGADGARSSVRDIIGIETRRWSYHQHAIVGTVRLGAPHRDTCYQAFLTSGPLAFLPLADPHHCSIVWSLDDDQWPAIAELNDDDFIAALNRASADRVPDVVGVASRASFPLTQCHAVEYTKPGIALVADAAHSIHPLAGQGINLGLKDVAVLSDELGKAFRQGLELGDLSVLRRYQRRRMTDNLAMMAAMEAFKRGFGSDHPVLRVARNAGLGWVDGLGPIKQWLAQRALT